MILPDLNTIRLRCDLLKPDDLIPTCDRIIRASFLEQYPLFRDLEISYGNGGTYRGVLAITVQFAKIQPKLILGVRRQKHLAAYIKWLVPEFRYSHLRPLGYREDMFNSWLGVPQHKSPAAPSEVFIWNKTAIVSEKEMRMTLKILWFLQHVTLKDLDQPPKPIQQLTQQLTEETIYHALHFPH